MSHKLEGKEHKIRIIDENNNVPKIS